MNINSIEQYFYKFEKSSEYLVHRLANFVDEKLLVQSHGGSGINEYVAAQFDATLDWNDVKWLVKYELHLTISSMVFPQLQITVSVVVSLVIPSCL